MKTSLALFFLVFALDCSAQSVVADAARQERERQKGLTSTITVTGMAANTAVTTAGTVPVVKPVELKDNNGHDEKYWRKRFDEARTQLKRAEDRVQLLDTKVKGLNTDLLTRSDIYNRENRLGPQITNEERELEAARKELDRSNQKISDLEDELHKAGGPPGWGR